MLNYSKETHQKQILESAINTLSDSINNARNEVNKKYLSKDISLYEMTNQLFIFDFIQKFLEENLAKNGLTGLLDLYENFPFPLKQDFENFNSIRFFLCSMIGTKEIGNEFENFKNEGI